MLHLVELHEVCHVVIDKEPLLPLETKFLKLGLVLEAWLRTIAVRMHAVPDDVCKRMRQLMYQDRSALEQRLKLSRGVSVRHVCSK
jgi:hypothetical protein